MLDHLPASCTCLDDGQSLQLASPWRQDFGRGVHAPDVFSTNSANFRVVLVAVAFSFFFINFLFQFLFLCGDFEKFFLWVEIVSESTLIETSFARQPHGASILILVRQVSLQGLLDHFAIGERAVFSVLTLFKHSKDVVDSGKACLVPLKKPALEGCLLT